MNPRALRITMSKVAAALCTAASAVILGSCGGSGAGASFTGGPLTLQPDGGTFYAGVSYTFTVGGGVVPYLVSSSEPELFPLPPQELSGHSFTVIPQNPGVVDAGLQPDELQGRTVVVQVRDKNGAIFRSPSSNGIFVARNFLTSYGVSFVSGCGAAPGGGAAPNACAGGDSFAVFRATINGNIFKNRLYRLERTGGQYGFVSCERLVPTGQVPTSTTPATDSITCMSDDAGILAVRFRVEVGVATQLATFRVVDVSSGVTTLEVFTISGQPPADALEIIPSDITMTGAALTTTCGRGPAGAMIFNGEPPYTSTSSTPSFAATFLGNQVVINGSGACGEGTIVVVDSRGRRGEISVTAEASAITPPAFDISPTTVSLNNTCGFSSSVLMIGGGTNPINALSSHPRLTVLVSGNAISVGRIASGDGATVYPATGTVTLSDGTVFKTITVNAIATNCP